MHKPAVKRWIYRFAAVLLLLGEPGATWAQVDTAATWVARNCKELTSLVFPEPGVKDWTFSPGKPLVTVRLGGEFALETRILLYFQGEALVAEVIQAQKAPLCEQLLKLKRADPQIELQGAFDRLSVRRETLSEKNAPRLRKHYLALQRVDAGLWPGDTLFAPGRSVTVKIKSLKEEVAVSYSEPDPSAEGVAYAGTLKPSQAELAKWVRGLLKILGLSTAQPQ